MTNLFDTIRLYTTHDKFIFEPLTTCNTLNGNSSAIAAPKKYLSIDRKNSLDELHVTHIDRPEIDPLSGVQDIFGILGFITLLKGPYLLVIREVTCVGVLWNKHKIYKIEKVNTIPFLETTLDKEKEQDERLHLSMLENMFVKQFWFSHSYDITHTVQHNFMLHEDQLQQPLCKRADPRFFWNSYLMSCFIKRELYSWIVPVTMGCIHNAHLCHTIVVPLPYTDVQIERCQVVNASFSLCLISRRNIKRAGLRYVVRGIDVEGNVANNVETEQIVQYGDEIASFVQTRGSIPLFWNQKVNLQYKPIPKITQRDTEATGACRRHFEEQIRLYGNQVIVNLIDQKGPELELGEAYENQIRLLNNDKIKYVAFDFHRQCRKMRYDKLSVLLDQVKPDLDKEGFLCAHLHSQMVSVSSYQLGAFRTNCIDNLDRTNVVQCLFARYVLQKQLLQFNVFKPGDRIVDFPQFETQFKDVWANNGDALSFQYTGTKALKGDFTRTGRRSLKGVIEDGANSCKRYYLNNFRDGFLQDAYDLFLGNYVIDHELPISYSNASNRAINNLYFAILLVGGVMLIFSLFMPAEMSYVHKFGAVLFWVVGIIVSGKTLLYYGPELVNRPIFVNHN